MVHDVQVEVPILVEVEPPRGQADGGQAVMPAPLVTSSNLAAFIPIEAVRPVAGQEEVDAAVGVEVAGRDAQARAIVTRGRIPRSRPRTSPRRWLIKRASRTPRGPLTAEQR